MNTMEQTPYTCWHCRSRFGVVVPDDGKDLPVEWCPFCGDDDIDVSNDIE